MYLQTSTSKLLHKNVNIGTSSHTRIAVKASPQMIFIAIIRKCRDGSSIKHQNKSSSDGKLILGDYIII